jgi:hypothetical protein
MLTYYRDATVTVTSEAVRVDDRVLPVRALDRVWHERGPRSWRVTARRGALGAALLAPLLAAAVGLLAAVRLHTSLTVSTAVAGVALLVGLAAGPLADLLLDRMDRSYDRGAHELRLWVQVDGRPTVLLRTPDALRFGRIYRALQRAVENNDHAL